MCRGLRYVFLSIFLAEDGNIVSINSIQYVSIVKKKWNFEDEESTGKVCGFSKVSSLASMAAVWAFPDRVISCFGDVPCPPRLSDLSICDIYLWNYLKTHVYKGKPYTLEELKAIITNQINKEIPGRVETYFQNLFQMFIRENEISSLSDIIFCT